MEFVALGLFATAVVIAFVDWRRAVYVALFLDAVRDPLRKLSPGEPIWISQGVVIVWGAIFLACLANEGATLRALQRQYPRLQNSLVCLLMALVPGAMLSLLLYSNGWILVVIGAGSYLGPLIGILIGSALAKKPQEFFRIMSFFVVVNSIVLTGNLAEWLGWNWPALGGLTGHEWIRHMPGVLVRMASGFYRSPDISGFHAAHVVVFSILLTLPRVAGGVPRPQWLPVAVWGLFTLVLCGRRKMLSIPVIFLLLWMLLESSRRQKGVRHIATFIMLSLLLVGGAVMYLVSGDAELEHHQIYLATTIYDAPPKLYGHAVQGSLVTIRQSGILGSGLGIATQGAQYSGVARTKAWQEDGISRLFKELGVVGVLLVLAAFFFAFQAFRRAYEFKLSDRRRLVLQTGGLAVLGANLACFTVSHQHISGDPANGLLPLMFLGGILGHAVAEARQRQTAVPQAAITSEALHRIGAGAGA